MRFGRFISIAALAAIAVPIYFASAALGSRFGVWDWKFGLGVLTKDFGPYVVYSAIGVCAITAGLLIAGGRRVLAAAALAFTLIPLASLGYLRYQQHLVLALPAIYDVQTNWDDPISFSEDRLQRRAAAGATNAVTDAPIVFDDGRRGRWAGLTFAEAQARGYPEIQPRSYLASCDVMRAHVLTAADRINLFDIVVTTNDHDTLVEATARTFWYGLSDDIAVRLRWDRKLCRIDMRSVSREGHIDLGVNANRITKLFEQIEIEREADRIRFIKQPEYNGQSAA